MSLISRIVKVFRGDRLSREIEERASCFADMIDNNRERGDASGNARVNLWLDSLRADFVLAWRRLRTSKVTSGAAIVSLAFGIGACLAAFQLIDALLLRPLPIAAPDRLYAISRQEFPSNAQPTTRETWEYPLFREMRAAVASQATLIAISERRTRGNQLALRWRNRKSARAIRFRRYVRNLRTPCRLRSPALAKRRPPDWRPSGCRLVTRLLVPAFCPRSANHRANFPPHQ